MTPVSLRKGNRDYYIVADIRGSVRLVVNAVDGTVVQRIDYDAFGQIQQDSNPGYTPFAFAGGLHDSTTGLTHFGARDYDAESGRWTAADPIGFASGDVNFYGYVANDPVNFVDPTGLSKVGGAKSVNLPAWKKVKIDIDHITSGHTKGGTRVSSRKSLFPEKITKKQLEKLIREAYRQGKKIETQLERVLVRGNGIEMWVNTVTRTIETAYPFK